MLVGDTGTVLEPYCTRLVDQLRIEAARLKSAPIFSSLNWSSVSSYYVMIAVDPTLNGSTCIEADRLKVCSNLPSSLSIQSRMSSLFHDDIR